MTCSNYVLVETFALVQRRLGKERERLGIPKGLVTPCGWAHRYYPGAGHVPQDGERESGQEKATGEISVKLG